MPVPIKPVVDYGITAEFPDVPDEFKKLVDVLNKKKIGYGIRNTTILSGAEGVYVPYAKVATLDAGITGTLLLINQLPGSPRKGNSFGRWWSVANEEIPKIYHGRSSEVAPLQHFKGGWPHLVYVVSALCREHAGKMACKSFWYPPVTGEDPMDEAIRIDISYENKPLLQLGMSYDLQFNKDVSTVWQLD